MSDWSNRRDGAPLSAATVRQARDAIEADRDKPLTRTPDVEVLSHDELYRRAGEYHALVERVLSLEVMLTEHAEPEIKRLRAEIERLEHLWSTSTKPLKGDNMTDNRFEAANLYDRYRVTIALRDRICGGMPKNAEVIATWIKSRTKHDDELTQEQTDEALAVLVAEETESCWTGFPSDDDGLFIWARQIKAMFKEAATMLRLTTQKVGSKQILQHGFEIKGTSVEGRVHLGVKEPTGSEEGPIHVRTAQGPRTALKRFDYVDGAKLTFDVWVLQTAAQEKRHVGEKELIKMLTFSQENGLGANRSQGYGKFDVVEFAKTS